MSDEDTEVDAVADEEEADPETVVEEADDNVGDSVEFTENAEDEHLPGSEEDDEITPNPLTQEIVAEGLSLLCKTGDGLSHAYVRLDIRACELTDIELLQSYIHLRYLDISKNMLKDISPISALTHLLTLKADGNRLASAKLEEMPFLQVASFNSNRIVTTEGITHPLLEHLCLNNNRIKEITGIVSTNLSRLHTLELRGNRLETTDGIYLPNLKNLFMAANMIRKIEGMSRLPGLTTIHLRGNQLENLLGFSEVQKNLQYINLRANLVASVKESSKLSVLPILRALVLAENPCSEQDDYRLETLIGIPTLERLDKDEFTDEERAEATAISEQRRKEEEEKATLEAQILSEIEITEKAILEAEGEGEIESFNEQETFGDEVDQPGDPTLSESY